VGFNYNSFELTGVNLSGEALELMGDWLHWWLWGGPRPRKESEDGSALKMFWDYAVE